MKRLILFSIMAAGLISCQSRNNCEGIRFSNPVISSDHPDPTAIFCEEDGCYYSTATGWNVPLWRSTDLVNWEETDIRPFSECTDSTMRTLGQHCWAPQLTKIAGRYLLYQTIRSGARDSRIVVSSAETVTGPYEFKGVVTDGLVTGIKDTIDPYVFKDEESGKVWLVFGSIGGIHIVELDSDGLGIKEGAEYIHIAGRDVNEDLSRLTVFEGSYMYKHDGWWYLFASAGQYNDYSYAILTGRSRTPEGPFTDRNGRNMTEGYAEVVLSSSPYDVFYGPGHNGEIFRMKDGREYMIYHVHHGDYRLDRIPGGYIPRPMNLQQIHWDAGGWPYFDKDGTPGGTILP